MAYSGGLTMEHPGDLSMGKNHIIYNSPPLKYVDSFQKLQILLFLYRNPDFSGTCHEFATKMFVFDELNLQDTFDELKRAGFVEFVGGHYQLRNHPAVLDFLGNLAEVYEDPLDRQFILDIIS